MVLRWLVLLAVVFAAAPAAPSQATAGECAMHTAHTGAHEQTSCGMTKLGSVEVSETAGIGQLEIRDGLAAVVQREDGKVALVDVKDPAAPRVLGRYDANTGEPDIDQPYDGDVAFSHDGRYLFYARQTHQWSSEGLHVVDITDPANPRLAAYAPAGGAFRVAYHRAGDAEYAVLLDAITGMQVFRFQRAAPAGAALLPVHVDALPQLKVGGPASAGVFVDPQDPQLGIPLLYVSTGKTGLDVFDFSAPESPSKLGSWSTAGLADFSVVAVGGTRTVYAATEYWFNKQTRPRIIQLDATDLGAMSEVRRFSPGEPAYPAPIDWQVQGLTFVEGLLYVAHSHGGLGVVDPCCVPGRLRASTTELGDANTGGDFTKAAYAMDVEVVDAVVYVTDAATGTLSTYTLDPLPEG